MKFEIPIKQKQKNIFFLSVQIADDNELILFCFSTFCYKDGVIRLYSLQRFD